VLHFNPSGRLFLIPYDVVFSLPYKVKGLRLFDSDRFLQDGRFHAKRPGGVTDQTVTLTTPKKHFPFYIFGGKDFVTFGDRPE
jgi:hypothetical protein